MGGCQGYIEISDGGSAHRIIGTSNWEAGLDISARNVLDRPSEATAAGISIQVYVLTMAIEASAWRPALSGFCKTAGLASHSSTRASEELRLA